MREIPELGFTCSHLFQWGGGTCLPGGEQAGSVPCPAGERGGGPLPGPGKQVLLPGGFCSWRPPGDLKPLHQAYPQCDGIPETPGWPAALQRVQVHGKTDQQCFWEEEEVRLRLNSVSDGEGTSKQALWLLLKYPHVLYPPVPCRHSWQRGLIYRFPIMLPDLL